MSSRLCSTAISGERGGTRFLLHERWRHRWKLFAALRRQPEQVRVLMRDHETVAHHKKGHRVQQFSAGRIKRRFYHAELLALFRRVLLRPSAIPH